MVIDGKFTFDRVWTNVGGGYQTGTNDFVCPVSGHYMFYITFETQGKAFVTARVTLEGEDNPIMYGDSMGIGFANAGQLYMMHCSSGQRVYVVSLGTSNVREGHRCTFSGMLISGDD